jgi:antitoxin (DNA-binding transcriptional repressor) of toxin-antitoxin stability system
MTAAYQLRAASRQSRRAIGWLELCRGRSAWRRPTIFVYLDFMKLRISASEAVRSFPEIMNRVRYRGESFVVERGGKPICAIVPARPAGFSGADLVHLLRSLPRPDEQYFVGELPKNQAAVAESGWQR